MSSIGRHVSKLAGYAPALPTPFGADGDIDIPAFERLCDLQLAHGATALIVCGTTGEAPHIDPGRTSFAHPNCRRTDSRANSCHCRGRRERNSACDRINPGRRGSRGGRGLVSCAVLQQADAGGALRSLPGDSRNRRACRLSFMTCRRERPVVFQIIRLRGWRSCRASLGLRMRRATRRGRPACDRWSARISDCCAERMPWLCSISHRVATGAFQ